MILRCLAAWSIGIAMSGRSSPFGVREVLVLSAFGVLALLILFELGTIQIAPPAENRSTRVRLLACAGVVLGTLSCQGFVHEGMKGFVWFLTLLILVPTCIGSLCESIRPVRSLYAPLLTRGGLRRVFAIFFCPGWPAGVAFTT